uniref:Uncharacterized protein n=1 Tax=Arundo donax TaxID=35708 RepID=A0A0A9F2H9_ARUDO
MPPFAPGFSSASSAPFAPPLLSGATFSSAFLCSSAPSRPYLCSSRVVVESSKLNWLKCTLPLS